MKKGLFVFLIVVLPKMAEAVPIPFPVTVTNANAVTDGDSVLFELTFAGYPDFLSHDAIGRPATSFQWYLTTDLKARRPMAGATVQDIIRGDGYGSDGAARLCGAAPYGAGCPGGWGPDLGLLQTVWDGGTLTAKLPVSLLGTGMFAYDVISLQYGAQNDWFYGVVDGGDGLRMNPIPETNSALLMVAALAFCCHRWATKRY